MRGPTALPGLRRDDEKADARLLLRRRGASSRSGRKVQQIAPRGRFQALGEQHRVTESRDLRALERGEDLGPSSRLGVSR